MRNTQFNIVTLLGLILLALVPIQISSQNLEDPYWLRMEYGPDYLKNKILLHKGLAQVVNESQDIEGIEEYEVEISEKWSTIELSVANTSVKDVGDLEFKILQKPSWITIEKNDPKRIQLNKESHTSITLRFKVGSKAKLDEIGELSLGLSSRDRMVWSKQYNIKPVAPTEFTLFDNYPNPFNPSTNIRYNLPEKGTVKIEIFNILGQKVTVLVDELQTAGSYTKTWDASNVASGMYLYRMTVLSESGKKFFQNKKMLLIK